MVTGYWLPRIESVSSWKLKIFFLLEMYAGLYDKTISIIFIKTCY